MLHLTSAAKEKISFFMKDRSPAEWGLKIKNLGGMNYHFSLVKLDSISPQEVKINLEGNEIVVDIELAKKLEQATIDYQDTAWSSGFKLELPLPKQTNTEFSPLDLSDPTVKKIQKLLNEEINPAIASHGGSCELLGLENQIAYLKLGGGCQGCSSSQATLRNGIELRIKEECPEIIQVIDKTDHASGLNPYL